MKNLITGIKAYLRAKRFVVTHKLWPLLVVPGILSLVYAGVVLVLGIFFLDNLSEVITERLPEMTRVAAVKVVIHIFLWILALLVVFLTYKHVILVLFTPVIEYLAEVTEKIHDGAEPPPWSFDGFALGLAQGLGFNLIILGLTLLFSFLAWLLIFIPLLGGLISSFLLLIIQWYYTGTGLIAPVLERRGRPIRERLKFCRDHRGKSMGLGAGFTLMLMIPFIGWFFAPTLGAIAATLLVIDEDPHKEVIPSSSDDQGQESP